MLSWKAKKLGEFAQVKVLLELEVGSPTGSARFSRLRFVKWLAVSITLAITYTDSLNFSSRKQSLTVFSVGE
jgi:hypothetical protein